MVKYQVCQILVLLMAIEATVSLNELSGLGPLSFRNIFDRNRIVGGKEVEPNSLPWQVHTLDGCGGTILCSKFIMTAAHCPNQEGMTVTVGMHDIRNANELTRTRHLVEKVHDHPNYDGDRYDVAIL